ncbi:MAG TPA: energy transducer TonB [Bacteroidia bacterium]
MKSIYSLAFFSIFSLSLSVSAQKGTTAHGDTILIETFPVWPGCEDNAEFSSPEKCFNAKLAEHIRTNLKYPPLAVENEVQGRVNISFVISYEGEVTDIKLLGDKKLGYGLETEAVRVIKLLPAMKPATSNGQSVNMKYRVPIVFKLM